MSDSAATLFAGEDPLPFDPRAALDRLRKADRKLGTVIEAVGPFRLRLERRAEPFEALAQAIVHQQLTGRAAGIILARLRALSGGDRFLSPREVLELPDEAFRAAGLSRPKTAALRDLAARALDGTVPCGAELEAMADDDIVARLTAVRGIGRWTVEMLLIFNLGRPDVLPVADYGLRKGFMRAFGTRDLPKPGQVAARGERWRPYRSVASWYLWRASELPDATLQG